MAEPEQTDEQASALVIKKRPLLLIILCVATTIFFGLLSALFLAGFFGADQIISVMDQYNIPGAISKSEVHLFFGLAFLLHGIALAGVILILNLRKAGYYVLGLSSLIIAGYQLTHPASTIVSTIVYILFILAFGLFFRRLR